MICEAKYVLGMSCFVSSRRRLTRGALVTGDQTGARPIYVSPLTGRIADIRTRILEQARDHAWIVEESQLDDRLIVRRMILKRVVYGVDKNPMARSEEHTSELQSLMRNSYAVFCLKKKTYKKQQYTIPTAQKDRNKH